MGEGNFDIKMNSEAVWKYIFLKVINFIAKKFINTRRSTELVDLALTNMFLLWPCV